MALWTDARINAALDAALDGGDFVQLHTGDPGSSGTGNVASSVSRTSASWGAASSKAASCSVVWTIPAAGGPYTNFSVWSASTGGTFYGSGSLDPSTTFESSGTLTSTLTASGVSS